MSDLNLPASLERLEINPERVDCCKVEETQTPSNGGNDTPECSLESLSLKAVCPKGNCQCNKRKEKPENGNSERAKYIRLLTINKLRDKGVKRLVQRRPILRRSKLSPAVLRAPILKLPPTVPHLETTKVLPNAGLNTPGTSKEGPSVIRGRFQTEKNTPACIPNPPQYSVGDYNPDRVPRIPLETLYRVNGEVQRSNSQSCCAVQARIAAESPQSQSSQVTADDTNIDELASYFDLFVHIPKKMSVMAEMMYI